MANSLILYCKEKAIPWEACKNRPCKTSKCLFSRAVKAFGTDKIGLKQPKRYSAVNTMVEDRDELIEGGKILEAEKTTLAKTPVLKRTPILATSGAEHKLPNDFLRVTIEEKINAKYQSN